MSRLYGAVDLQHGLVVDVGQLVALQSLVGCRPPQEGFDAERDQLQRAVRGETVPQPVKPRHKSPDTFLHGIQWAWSGKYRAAGSVCVCTSSDSVLWEEILWQRAFFGLIS